MTQTFKSFKMTADDIEEILDLAIELASEDLDELNAAEEFQLLSLNYCEQHYVQKALDQLQTPGKNKRILFRKTVDTTKVVF